MKNWYFTLRPNLTDLNVFDENKIKKYKDMNRMCQAKSIQGLRFNSHPASDHETIQPPVPSMKMIMAADQFRLQLSLQIFHINM